MNTARIVAALDEELLRLRQVRDLLAGSSPDTPVKARRGRPPKSAATPALKSATKAPGKKRNLSVEARQRIAEAQKRRWAAQKSAGQQ